MAKSSELQFEASAYLQTLIGGELFRRTDFAIIELIKNAYDSGAKIVLISVTPPSLSEPGEITVSDDGSGMTLDDFERLFMVAGFSERPDQLRRVRVPTGEKGVGRFATDRLGSRLEVITKTRGDKQALRVDIDWERFKDRTKKFSDIRAPYRFVPPERIPQSHGTVLRITGLKSQWDRTELAQLRSALAGLLDPFDPPTDFEIHFNVARSEKLSGIVTPPSLEGVDLEVRFRVEKDGRLRRWRKTPEEGRASEQTIPATPETKQLAGLTGRFLYFLKRPPARQVDGASPGVRVYRDGFQIQPFGDARTDWLHIEEKRAKRAGHAHIVPTRLYGFVGIKRTQHPELRDITSREALLDTDSARALVSVLKSELSHLEDTIRTSVAEPRWEQNRAKRAIELEQARLHALSMMSFGMAHELRQPLQAIRSEANNIVRKLSAMGIKDDDIAEAEKSIENNIQRIDNNIKFIAGFSASDLEAPASVDLAELILKECAFFQNRASSQGIALRCEAPKSQPADLNATGIAIVITNLITNAIDAFDAAGDRAQRTITVNLRATRKEHVIEVVDTAGGIPDDVASKIFTKFVTQKTGGWGVGLYNCRLIVGAQGGEIDYQTRLGVGTKFTVRLPRSTGVGQ